jgi:hypothetical protein
VTVLTTGVACGGGGGDDQKAKPASSATSAPPASDSAAASTQSQIAAEYQQMMQDVMAKLAQATNDGGAPRALTREEVEALLRTQMQNFGIQR